MVLAANQECHTSVSSFVDSRVLQTAITKDILEQICCYFPTSCKVIAGYLPSETTYWRVNHFWDALHQQIKACLLLPIESQYKSSLRAILLALESNPPDPPTGYYQRGNEKLGLPHDKSSSSVLLARHSLLSQSQKDVRQVIEAAGIRDHLKAGALGRLDYALNPVRKPGTSNHIKGYALDITGDHPTIIRIATSLGATLKYPESPHVHVEFEQGVTFPEDPEKGVSAAKQAVHVAIHSKLIHHTHVVST